MDILTGILIPFIGTGRQCLRVLSAGRIKALECRKHSSGFASGVMVAASVWSLLIRLWK